MPKRKTLDNSLSGGTLVFETGRKAQNENKCPKQIQIGKKNEVNFKSEHLNLTNNIQRKIKNGSNLPAASAGVVK